MARNTVLNIIHEVELLQGREATLIEAIVDHGFDDKLFMELCDVQYALAEAKALIQE